MTQDHPDDWLDAALREPAHYIDDDGFTARVLAAIPARRRPWYSSRAAVILASTVAASAIGLAVPGTASYLISSLLDLFLLRGVTPGSLAILVPLAVLYAAVFSAALREP